MEIDMTNIDEIDADHTRIIHSLRAIKDLVCGRHDPCMTCKVLSIVLDDMEKHCRKEEDIARTSGIDSMVISQMKEEHAWLMAEYNQAKNTIKNHVESPPNEALLMDWLIELTIAHIQSVDVPSLGRYYGSRKGRTVSSGG